MEALLETVSANPGVFFIAGTIVGYFLRGALSKVNKKDRSGRYSSIRSGQIIKKRSPTKLGAKEPSFDWINRTANNVAEKQASFVLDHSNTEI